MQYHSFDELPVLLTVADLADVLQIGRNKAYSLSLSLIHISFFMVESPYSLKSSGPSGRGVFPALGIRRKHKAVPSF